MNVQAIITTLIAIVVAVASYLTGYGNWLNARMGQRREAGDASGMLVTEALALVEALSTQIKDLREHNLTLEQRQAKEILDLQAIIAALTTQKGELEQENQRLKAQLYSQRERTARTRPTKT